MFISHRHHQQASLSDVSCSQSSWPAQTQQGSVGGEDSSVARRTQRHDEVTTGRHVPLNPHAQLKERNMFDKHHLKASELFQAALSRWPLDVSSNTGTLSNYSALQKCRLNIVVHSWSFVTLSGYFWVVWGECRQPCASNEKLEAFHLDTRLICPQRGIYDGVSQDCSRPRNVWSQLL